VRGVLIRHGDGIRSDGDHGVQTAVSLDRLRGASHRKTGRPSHDRKRCPLALDPPALAGLFPWMSLRPSRPSRSARAGSFAVPAIWWHVERMDPRDGSDS
jgi:hypothetical protein